MKHILATTSALALAAGLFAPLSANAGVLGDSINETYYFPDLSSVYENDGTQTVSPTASWVAFGIVHFDMSATQLVETLPGYTGGFAGGAFNGGVFTDLTKNWGPVTIDAATNWPGFGAGDVTLSGNLLEVNMQGLAVGSGYQVVLDLGSVPEPASMAVLGVGLLGLGLIRRKRA